jgi:23S rRNA (uracil1939-C5)-methyltransferase
VTAVGDLIPLTIDKIVHGGWGMARWDGAPVFVGNVLAREQVAARVTALRKGYVEAEAERVLTPSESRVSAPCPVYPACGGCQLQHAAYPAQLAVKRAIVRETFQRLGGLDVEVPPVAASPAPFGYRLRAQLKIGWLKGAPVFGFFAARSHRVIATPTCQILHPRLQTALSALRDVGGSSASGANAALSGVREVELQTTATTDQVIVILHVESLRSAAVSALAAALRALVPLRGLIAYAGRTRRVEGHDWLEERIDGLPCRVSDRTFLQVNAGANAALIAAVVGWAGLTGRERVVDLYAGFGNLSIPLAGRSRVTAVESSPSAAADARCNARATGRPVSVIGRRVEAWRPPPRDRHPDLVVLDPPRAGLSRVALARVVELDAPRLLYVSCEPATLARDAARFANAGYRVARVRCFDFFPHTAHVETLAELHRAPRGY